MKKLSEKIENKIYILIIITVIISLVSAFIYTYRIKESADIQIKNNIYSQMSQTEAYVSKHIRNTMINLETSGSEMLDKSKREQDLSEDLKSFAQSHRFLEISIIDQNGVLYSKDGTVYDDDLSDDDVIQAFEGKSSISNPVPYKAKGQRVIKMVQPIYIENDIEGVVVGLKSVRSFQQEMTAEFSNDSGFAYVIDSNGDQIFDSHAYDDKENNFYSFISSKFPFMKSYLKLLKDSLPLNQKGIIPVYNESGDGYLSYCRISENNNWYVVYYIYNDVFFHYSNRIVCDSICMSAFVILILLLFSLYIIKSEQKKMEEIERLSFTDMLTKIGNSTKFCMISEKILKKNKKKKYVFVIFDINNFKSINHSFGYDVGDEILKSIARKLETRFKNNETCGRLDNDKFIVLAKYNDNIYDEIKHLLNQILTECVGIEVSSKITFNFGAYIVERGNKENIISIIDKAETAFKIIKNSPRNELKVYDDKLLNYLKEKTKIEACMYEALKNNEFKVYLQPKVLLETNNICGAEALVRWSSDELGFMPPDLFIPLFEQNGFVSELDFYVLEKVCNKIEEFLEQDLECITVSVNQSRVTISDPDYLKRLHNITLKHHEAVKYIELEITENIFVAEYDEILKIMDKMKELGFKLSMDDFGSGYSSLNLLKKMPIDVLKLDKLFFDESSTSEKSRAIIRRIVDMARDIDIKVICEGVETFEQVKFLKEIKCDMAQGYYYDKPMPMEAFTEKMLNNIDSVVLT